MFKEIPGFPDYEIDQWGNIWSLKKNKPVRKFGASANKLYPTANLKIGKNFYKLNVSRAILSAFVGTKDSTFHACHIDGNPVNTCLSNLMWGTAKENSDHKYTHGTVCFGEKSPVSKITDEQALQIRNEFKKIGIWKTNAKQLAKKYGMKYRNILIIVYGKGWKHLGGKISKKCERLSDQSIREIRSLYKRQSHLVSNSKELSLKYGVCRRSITQIAARKLYKDVV